MTERYELSFATPLGPLRLVASEAGLCGIYYFKHSKPEPAGARAVDTHPLLDRARAQLEAYFDGSRERFELPLAPEGTVFQREVWAALAEIPFGETCCYADIARAIGRPKAVRAVGAANGRNPLSIVVPCHRVIGSNGSLTGYAGGLERKRWLLALEAGRGDAASSRRQGELF